MLGYGKITDTIYQRSVKKVIERTAPEITGDSRMPRDVSCVKMANGLHLTTATATLAGEGPAVAGTVHLAVNRLAAAGSRAQSVAIQLIVPEDLPEKKIKNAIERYAKSCKYLQLAGGQADVTVASGLTESVIVVTASGESDSLFKPAEPEADQDIIMAGYAGSFGAAQLAFAHQKALIQHFNPVFLSPVLEADDIQDTISALPAMMAAAEAGIQTMYACGEGGVYAAVWELAEQAGLGARIQLKKVPLQQETVEICDYFNISPYQLISAGAVLMTATHGQKLLDRLAAAGIPAVIIGHLTDDNDRVVINDDEVRFLEPFRQDSLNQAIQ